MNHTTLFRMGRLCLDVFDGYGLAVDDSLSFAEFEDRMSVPGKPDSARTFNPADQYIPRDRQLALIFHQDGKDIGGLLARSIDLGESDTVENYLLGEQFATYERFRPSRRPRSIAREMSGRVCYMGEFFVADDLDRNGEKWRGKPCLAPAMVRFMMCLAFSKWNLNWLFAVLSKEVRERDDRVRLYGFSRVVARAQDWEGGPDRRRTTGECIVSNSAQEYEDHLEDILEDPERDFPGYTEFLQRTSDRKAAKKMIEIASSGTG